MANATTAVIIADVARILPRSNPAYRRTHHEPGDIGDDDKDIFGDTRGLEPDCWQHNPEHQLPPQAYHRDADPDHEHLTRHGCGTLEFQHMQQSADELSEQANQEKSECIDEACTFFAAEVQQHDCDACHHDQQREMPLSPEISDHVVPETHRIESV
jgi:hypothetical protein